MATNPDGNRWPLNPLGMSVYEGMPDHAGLHNTERERADLLADYLNTTTGYAPIELWGNVGDDHQTKIDRYTAYCQAKEDAGSPHVATLALGLKEYTISRTLKDLPRGWKIDGCGHGMNHQKSTQTDNASTRIKSVIPAVSGIGKWIDTTAGVTNWNNYFGNATFYDDGRTTQWFSTPGSAQFRECTWLNTTFQNSRSVWGSSAEPFRVTFSSCRGDQTLFNTSSTSFNIAGSDCVGGWFADGVDHYMPGDTITGQANAGQLWAGMFSSFGKSEIGPMYGTFFGGWRGYYFGGAESTFGTNIRGGVWEGNNAGQPCSGAIARFTGGAWALFGTIFDDGMANPSLTANKYDNGATADRALIEVLGSVTNVELWSPKFAHGTNGAGTPLPMTTPVLWASNGAKVGIHGVQTGARDTAWGSQLPVVGASTGVNAPTWVQRDYSTTNGPGVAALAVTNGLA